MTPLASLTGRCDLGRREQANHPHTEATLRLVRGIGNGALAVVPSLAWG